MSQNRSGPPRNASLLQLAFIGLTLCSSACLASTPDAASTALESPALTAEQTRAIYRFAPVIHQEERLDTDIVQRRSDFITSFDFDGDRQTNNTDAALRSGVPMEARVMAGLVETKTHRFLTIHLYHPADYDPHFGWIPIPLGQEHENDGECAQLVIEKGSIEAQDRLVLLTVNAHNSSRFYAPPGSPMRTKNGKLLPELKLTGERPSLWVKAGSHAIKGTPFRADFLATYTPANQGPGPGSMWELDQGSYRYAIDSIYEKLWRPYLLGNQHGQLVFGDGGAMDGSFRMTTRDKRFTLVVPAFYDSDRLSLILPWKRDAGVLPFRLGKSVTLPSTRGQLFFDPANEYLHLFSKVEGTPWATEYERNPYLEAFDRRAPVPSNSLGQH